jgi:transcription elongation factor Elf1
MDSEIVDRRVRCPHCGERIKVLLDLSAGAQSYIEDCQVCCQAMQIGFEVDDGECSNLQVDRAA